ncbi:hypothetical protein K9N68_15195 [Kovacikia minuta CCNUW1]|uniref:hypothetical protein n=1 Tax=Kovacikia minuta TaxID=2931930 RepID=UPI001CCCAE4F|nr:hypothetical protein [Kovacikia minuta]UBF29059.1 hypothetical protein K9N68_15195 [Kovacikia minuta CCNUW1]
MTNEANNILRQASQGSVAAIIQVLNEKLADSGVRTRAIFADGILQLLCEAATADQLEPDTLVERIRQILETIAPRNIHRVNINSRIVREQQLLWLEEINRDPENQLLWSKEIALSKQGFFKQLAKDWKNRADDLTKASLPKTSPRQLREKRQYWRGLMGGASASLLLLLVGWGVYRWLEPNFANLSAFKSSEPGSSQASSQTGAPATTPSSSPSEAAPPKPSSAAPPLATKTSAPEADSFVMAVRLAEQASQEGLTAKSSAQWLELASRWQQASDLMAKVADNDPRYKTAQDRVTAYQKNSESALQEAEKRKAQFSEAPEAGEQPESYSEPPQ